MHIRVLDDVIHATQVEDVPILFERIIGMRPGQSIRLVVNGIPGTWIKVSMRDAGAVRHAIAPVGVTAETWASLRSPSGRRVELHILAPEDHERDDYLRLVDRLMPEWNSPDDDEAYGGLRPL